jgi:hypothetical protein
MWYVWYKRLCFPLPTLLSGLTSVVIRSHLDRLVHLQLAPNHLQPLKLRGMSPCINMSVLSQLPCYCRNLFATQNSPSRI